MWETMLQCQQEDARGCSKQGEEGKSDDNKPIVVDIPTPPFKRGVGDLPTIWKKPRALPSSLSSDVTELSHLKREQMVRNDNYQKMQFGLEQRKVELLEQEVRSKCSLRLTSCIRGHSFSEKVCHKMK